ncbi:MAG: hypothetical protein WDA16_11525, partial [Candidatus Thermoplasmatota archaeon]
MTRAPLSRSRLATLVGAMMLAGSMIPLGLVAADNAAGSPDGLVVIVHPRSATLADSEVTMSAMNELYIFDVETYHSDGTPFLFTHWGAGILTFDPARPTPSEPCAGLPADSCIWTSSGTNAPTSRVTIRVPTSAVAWGGAIPGNGVAFGFSVYNDGNGNDLADANGRYPLGNFNPAANQLASDGHWAEADQADEAPTPIFLFGSQPTILIQPGNPIANPGFELYADTENGDPTGNDLISDGSAADGSLLWNEGYGSNAKFYDFDGNGELDAVLPPTGSSTQNMWQSLLPPLQIPSGDFDSFEFTVESGALSAYSNIQVGFSTSPLFSQNPWVVAFWDGAIMFPQSNMLPDSNGRVRLEPVAQGDIICPDYQPCLDFKENYTAADDAGKHALLAELRIIQVGFWSFNLGNTEPVVLDDVAIVGSRMIGDVQPRNDATDGYSTFIVPAHADLGDGTQAVIQELSGLAGGKQAYVYELSAMDYTSTTPDPVDLNAHGSYCFAIVDEASRADPEHLFQGSDAVPFRSCAAPGGDGPVFFRTLDPEGSVSDKLIAVVDPAQFNEAGTGSALGIVTAAFFVDIATDDAYKDTFGTASEPAVGYYSAARNNVAGFSIADSLDYAVTPIILTGIVGPSLASASTLALTCPSQTTEVTCSADPNPDMKVTFSSASRVIENVVVELV